MSEEFDLDVYVAEASKDPYKFTYRGQSWTLPHASDMDWRAVEAADMGNYAALRELFRLGLGEQWTEFEKLPQPAAAMTELFKRWQAHAGVKPGESQGSADSSESTAGPSTPASDATAAPASVEPSPAS
jgi:hypothetical protein